VAERFSGGVHIYSGTLILRNSQIYSNAAGWDGGGVNVSHSRATLIGNAIYNNSAALYSAGGVYLNYASHVTLLDNHIYSNTSSYFGGGVYLWTSSDITLTNNEIYSNRVTLYNGGGIYLVHSDGVLITGNHIHNNIAQLGGSGVAMNDSDGVTMTNNLVAENQIASPLSGLSGDAGILVYKSNARILHDTIVRNTGGIGKGIAVNAGSTLWVANTILLSHTLGISVAGGCSVNLNNTLWGADAWANDMDWGGDGCIVTTVNIHGFPDFVDPSNGDYHIGPASTAIDRGMNAGITTDIDGDSRPVGLAPDIGADEYPVAIFRQFIPLVLKNFP
jgi:parallel beta-helix repeat protein